MPRYQVESIAVVSIGVQSYLMLVELTQFSAKSSNAYNVTVAKTHGPVIQIVLDLIDQGAQSLAQIAKPSGQAAAVW